MTEHFYDVVIIGSGAGGGTVACELSSLCREGLRIVVLEKGPKLADHEFTGRELEMAQALYEEGAGFLTAEGTMTLAFGCVYGGSTTVYTGTSLPPPERVLRQWGVPGVTSDDLAPRVQKYVTQNNVHLLADPLINDNNRLFVEGCRRLGYPVGQFPVNVRGCRGSSLCNLGCPNQAKQGTDRVQLPRAEANGVEVVTRCEALTIQEKAVRVRVQPKPAQGKGEPSPWPPGEHTVRGKVVVVCAGAIHTPALLLRSGFGKDLPRLGRGFTAHPALIVVAEHPRPITNFVGHPKSFYLDAFAERDRFVLETCMYFPFTTAKSLVGFGARHSAFLSAFPRLQMILVLACDQADPSNRVTIGPGGRAVVHYRFTPEVVRALVGGAAHSAKIMFAAGADRVHLPVAQPPTLEAQDASRISELAREHHFKPGKVSVSAAHLQGGCAMGATRADSVTDGRGRVHGVPWLFVADASLFPNALEINPYLTIMALADRVAEKIREEVQARR